jgi:hypothetical protein
MTISIRSARRTSDRSPIRQPPAATAFGDAWRFHAQRCVRDPGCPPGRTGAARAAADWLEAGCHKRLGPGHHGVKEPACGFPLPRQCASGAEVSARQFVNLGVEAEIAFRIRAKLVGPGVTIDAAQRAVEGAVAALELATRGFSLEPGDIVMSGAITKMCDPRSGTRFEPSSHTSARSASQWCPETALRDPPSKCSEDGRGQARMECVADRLSSCCRT